ncbi:DEAD/DEAH box helicase [Kineobactrum salinum]|uniref:DEAD/DEAH box helicase n=1 Tax=Kineobactrum salinum TaxID=2708301 RepID=A0A6C0U9N7_9GAMM|nr:DEAD/DEAH box helicase [Kineobactrum salinum]QIB66404.1 DEAD/DEAH box helicase [Kineobactrum salinum]
MLEEFDLDRSLQLALAELAYTTATEVQQQLLPPALEGRDLRVSAPTGSGKTLAYLLPLLQRLLTEPLPPSAGILGLVLVPTRELARQVLKECRQLLAKSNLRADAVTGGADFKYQKSLLRKNPEVLVATPGRLLEHCERRSTDLLGLRVLVLDEADRMLEMGFREDVLKIAGFCGSERQTLMLSATLHSRGLGEISDSLQHEPVTISCGEIRAAHKDIFHQRILADNLAHKDALLLALLADSRGRKQLVFANKRSTAARLAGLLRHHGLRAGCLHGEMSTEERKQVVTLFSQGSVDIVTASDLAARGLDIEGIDTVINYDLPHSGDDYLHRTGRTGRAGAQGLAISLIGASDWNLMISIQRYLKLEMEPRSLPGLKARYAGPKKLKSSGKAAGQKKKSTDAGQVKKKERLRDKKARGRPRRKSADAPANDGFAPLLKKQRLKPES